MLIQYEANSNRSAAYDGDHEIGECCYSVPETRGPYIIQKSILPMEVRVLQKSWLWL